jgi:hypothetical protein
MRGAVLDPKRHYKKGAVKNRIPSHCHVGTIIEGPTEFHSARLNHRERRRTLVEEILTQKTLSARFKAKFMDIQKQKVSGKKSFLPNTVKRSGSYRSSR